MITGIVLVGGVSSRFGSDKASALLDGRPLLAHVGSALAAVCDEVVVVCRAEQTPPALDVRVPVRFAFDAVEGQGPLAGVVAGLEAAERGPCFIASCDIPLLRPELIEFLLGRLPGSTAAIPLVAGHEQPLVAAYECAIVVEPLRASLQAGVRRLRDAVMALDPLVVGETELRAADPDLSSFANVNDAAGLASLAARRSSR